MPVKKEVGEKKRKWHRLLPRGRELMQGPLSQGFYLFLVGETLGELSGEGSVEYSPVLRVCLFRVKFSTD